MELIDDTSEWSCYKPNLEYSKGHLVFLPKHTNGIFSAIETANNYGKGLVAGGLAISYLMLSLSSGVHVSPVYSDSENLNLTISNFLEFVNEQN